MSLPNIYIFTRNWFLTWHRNRFLWLSSSVLPLSPRQIHHPVYGVHRNLNQQPSSRSNAFREEGVLRGAALCDIEMLFQSLVQLHGIEVGQKKLRKPIVCKTPEGKRSITGQVQEV
jgi:hypothetical protein